MVFDQPRGLKSALASWRINGAAAVAASTHLWREAFRTNYGVGSIRANTNRFVPKKFDTENYEEILSEHSEYLKSSKYGR